MGSITRKKVSESELGKTTIMCSITRKKVSESELGKTIIMGSVTRKKVSESELGKTIIMGSITRKKVSESELGKTTIMGFSQIPCGNRAKPKQRQVQRLPLTRLVYTKRKNGGHCLVFVLPLNLFIYFGCTSNLI